MASTACVRTQAKFSIHSLPSAMHKFPWGSIPNPLIILFNEKQICLFTQADFVWICAADNINHDKYHDCDKTYDRIRHLSDELCKEHNLSIITPTGQRGTKYNEWQTNMRGASAKIQLRRSPLGLSNNSTKPYIFIEIYCNYSNYVPFLYFHICSVESLCTLIRVNI